MRFIKLIIESITWLTLLFSFSPATILAEPAKSFVRQHEGQILDSNGKPLFIKGVNLGGSFLWEGWMFGGGILTSETTIFKRLSKPNALGLDKAAQLREIIYKNWVQKEDLKRIRSIGFNTVRIPFNHTIIENPDHIIHLDRIIDWCEELGLYVIMDLHSAPMAQNAIGLISDWNWGEPTMWDWFKWKRATTTTTAIWQTIAKRYKSRKIILGYDLLNEPDTTHTGINPFNKHKLPKMYKAIIAGIREIDKNHMVILEGDKFAKDFSHLTEPLDANMAYQFHMYSWTLENDSYEKDIQHWTSIAKQQKVPIFAGEFGVDNTQEIESQIKALNAFSDQLSGWVIWSWKSTDNQAGEWNGVPSSEINHSIREIKITPAWQKVINYATKLSKEVPSQQEFEQGAKEFTEELLFKNTKENSTLIKVLFPNSGDSKN